MVCDRSLGILIGAGVASIFGVSLDILPVIILLILLAVYDAISVYKTKHMITLAEGVIGSENPDPLCHPQAAGLFVHQRRYRETG